MDDYGLDLEYVYPPKSTRIICASDEQHEALERRIAALETQVHRLLNSEPQPLGTERYAEYLDQGIYSSIGDPYVHVPDRLWHNIREELQELRQQPHPPEADFAHVPSSIWEDMVAELEALRAWKASVPWAALRYVFNPPSSCSAAQMEKSENAISDWLDAHAPKEATE